MEDDVLDFDELMQDASLLIATGQLDFALEALDDAQRMAGSDVEHARCLEAQAAVAIERRQYAKARDLMQLALARFGDEAPPSAWGNLGFILDRLGRFADAAIAHRVCVAAHEEHDGPHHCRTLRRLGDLACSMIGLGQLDDAESLLRRSVHGFETIAHREPLWHATALINLGYFLLRSRRDPEAALGCFDRAEALRDACSIRFRDGRIVRHGFPPDFEAVFLANRAEALTELGQHDEAARLRAEARIRRTQASGPRRRLEHLA